MDLLSISDKFQGILLDAYGVFWGGNAYGLMPGSKEVMEELVARGKIVGILSNSTQLAAKEIEKLEKHGLIQGKHYHFFITSGEVVRHFFLSEKLPFTRKSYWLLGDIHPKYSSHELLFDGTPYRQTAHIQDADFIYLSIPHIDGEDQTDPEIFRPQVEKIRSFNLPMICPNPDLFAHEGNPPRAVVRQGSIAKIYEELGGHVSYIGKPDPRAFQLALDRFRGIPKEKILMVGDTPETDIRGARRFGMPSALITQTGMMSGRSVHDLPAEDTPDFLFERLAYGIHSTP